MSLHQFVNVDRGLVTSVSSVCETSLTSTAGVFAALSREFWASFSPLQLHGKFHLPCPDQSSCWANLQIVFHLDRFNSSIWFAACSCCFNAAKLSCCGTRNGLGFTVQLWLRWCVFSNCFASSCVVEDSSASFLASS